MNEEQTLPEATPEQLEGLRKYRAEQKLLTDEVNRKWDAAEKLRIEKLISRQKKKNWRVLNNYYFCHINQHMITEKHYTPERELSHLKC